MTHYRDSSAHGHGYNELKSRLSVHTRIGRMYIYFGSNFASDSLYFHWLVTFQPIRFSPRAEVLPRGDTRPSMRRKVCCSSVIYRRNSGEKITGECGLSSLYIMWHPTKCQIASIREALGVCSGHATQMLMNELHWLGRNGDIAGRPFLSSMKCVRSRVDWCRLQIYSRRVQILFIVRKT